MFDVEAIREILEETKISSLDVLFLAYCSNRSDEDSLRCLNSLLKNKGKLGVLRETIDEAVTCKVIDGRLIDRSGKVAFADILPHPLFKERFLSDPDTMFRELLGAYPKTTVINGRTTPLMKGENIGGIYYDQQMLCELYLKKINASKTVHDKIIADLKQANELGLINFAFRHFVLDSMWTSLPDLIGGDTSSFISNKTSI